MQRLAVSVHNHNNKARDYAECFAVYV